jgi:tetratricopeptide (TPR) repeat protein
VIALNPSNAEARMMYETVSVDLDHTSEALDHYFLAEPADPLAEEPLQFRAYLLIWLGRLDEALTVIGNPAARTCQNVRTHNLLTDYYRTRGDLDRAVQEADLVINGHPPEADTPAAWKEAASAWRHILARNKEAERAILSKLEASPVSGLTLEFCGWWYADLGDVDACFRCWEQAARDHTLPAQPLVLDPSLAHIRKDPRFQPLMRSIGLA